MTAARRLRSVRAEPAPPQSLGAHWLNREWAYQRAASHGDASAFRKRMAERAIAARKKP